MEKLPTVTEINVWGETFVKPQTFDQAIANLKLWASIGFPSINKYKMWAYIPALRCRYAGKDNGIEVHEFELKICPPGNHRWNHLISSSKLDGSKYQAYQLFMKLLDDSDWKEGFFDANGDAR